MIEDDVVLYKPNFINNPDELFETLWNELDWERRENVPRREYWTNIFNAPYTYGRGVGIRTYESKSSHAGIDYVRDVLSGELGFQYEACFLNGYETGTDALGPHADDDPKIDHTRPIAVVTLGDGRDIEYMAIGDKTTKKRIFLENGSLFLMKAGMQSTHLHRIPRAGHVVKRPRISLTFRGLNEVER